MLLWTTMKQLKARCSGMTEKALVSMSFPGSSKQHSEKPPPGAQDIIGTSWKPLISATVNKVMVVGAFLGSSILFGLLNIIEEHGVPSFVGPATGDMDSAREKQALCNCLTLIKECGCQHQADSSFSVVSNPGCIIWASHLFPATLFLRSRPTWEAN